MTSLEGKKPFKSCDLVACPSAGRSSYSRPRDFRARSKSGRIHAKVYLLQ